MESLQDGLSAASDVGLLTISVDPSHDTPEILAQYAERFDADPERWLFVTGDHDTIYRLVRDGFMLAVAEAEPGEVASGELITHSDRLVIVDRHGRVRAYHHGTEADAVEAVMADLARLEHAR